MFAWRERKKWKKEKRPSVEAGGAERRTVAESKAKGREARAGGPGRAVRRGA